MSSAVRCKDFPVLAPKITEIAWGRLMSPALTKPITMTVVAELLCRTAVTKAPANAPIIGFRVMKRACPTSTYIPK